MSGLATFGDLGSTHLTDDQIAACRRHVLDRAGDDAGDILDALGIGGES